MLRGLFGLVVLVCLVAFFASRKSPPNATPAGSTSGERATAATQPTAAPGVDYGDEIAAKVQAERIIKMALKHPLDASFSWGSTARLTDAYGPKGLRNWVVSGTVKAPNDFGAELTKPYQVTLVADGGAWQCLVAYLDGAIVYQDDERIAATIGKPSNDEPVAIATPTRTAQQTADSVRRSIEASREGKPLYQSRTWKLKSGPVVARLKSFGAGKLRLETDGGELLELAESDVDAADLKFVRDGVR